MKKLLLLPLVILCFSLSVAAQNKTYRFQFNNRLSENFYQGSPLAPACPGSYSSHTLAGVYKTVYNFDKGCGLVFNDSATGLLASGTYTIELYFLLDTINGYKKIIDFDSLSADAGFYNQNGRLVMYNQLTSTDSAIGAGTWEYAAITRDGSTKELKLYHNDTLLGQLNDNADQYIYGSEKLLVFFRDDNNTSNNEQGSGSVAMIHISDFVMDATTVASHYSGLGSLLNIPEEEALTSKVRIWPNPAGDYAEVSSPANCTYTLCDITGRLHGSGALQPGANRLSLQQYPAGIYMLEIRSGEGSSSYKLVKQ